MLLTPDQQEEFDVLKKWWKDNGMMVIVTFTLTVAALGGWTYWQHYQTEKKTQASMAFEKLVPKTDTTSAKSPPLDTAKINNFIKIHKTSGYAPLAALLGAKAYVEKEDYEQASSQLKWVIANTDKVQLKEIAQFRLARVLLAQGKHQEALSITNATHDDAFAGLYAEVKGDIYLSKGDAEQARNAYKAAATHPGANQSNLQIKINEAGGQLN